MDNKLLVKRHFSKMAESYDLASRRRDKLELAGLGRSAGKKPGSVLDVGCGTGAVAFNLAKKAKKVWGIDITPKMLKEAQKKKLELGAKNVFFKIGDAEKIPFEQNSFDTITCRYSFHHFARPRKAFCEFARVLKRGGRVLYNDVIVPDDKKIAQEVNSIERKRHPSHVKYRSIGEIASIGAGAGLKLVSFGTVKIKAFEAREKPGIMERMALFKKASPKTRRWLGLRFIGGGIAYTVVSAIIVLRK